MTKPLRKLSFINSAAALLDQSLLYGLSTFKNVSKRVFSQSYIVINAYKVLLFNTLFHQFYTHTESFWVRFWESLPFTVYVRSSGRAGRLQI